MPKVIKTWTDQVFEACQGVEVITGGLGGMATGLPVAEKLGVKFVRAELQPIGAPTDAYPGVLLSGVPRWLGGFGRRLSHAVVSVHVGGHGQPLSRGRILGSASSIRLWRALV